MVKYVYIINICHTKKYKIGISSNVERRLDALQTSNPDDLSIVYKRMSKDANTVESTLHSTYSSKRIRGEWFTLETQDVYDIIKYIECYNGVSQEYISTPKNNNSRKLTAFVGHCEYGCQRLVYSALNKPFNIKCKKHKTFITNFKPL